MHKDKAAKDDAEDAIPLLWGKELVDSIFNLNPFKNEQ